MNKVALTGGTGFVGSFLTERLLEEWYEVTLLKRSTSNLNNIEHLIRNNLLSLFDIDKSSLTQFFRENHIDISIHLATSYGRKWESASQIVESTILLPMQLLEASLNNNVKAFINTDSFFNQSIHLSDNIGIHAESKRDFLKYAKQLLHNKPMHFLNLIMWHVYGPRDHEKKLVPAMITKLLANEPYIDLVEGNNQRNFIYVKDLVNVYMTLIRYVPYMEKQFEDFYDRTGEVVTVKEMVLMLKELTNSSSQFNFWAIPDRPNEIMSIEPDTNTTVHKLWRAPQYTIKEWLRETIEFYKIPEKITHDKLKATT